MTDEELLRHLVSTDGATRAALLRAAATSTRPALLVAVAVIRRCAEPLVGAARHAVTSRERQLVVLAAAHLAGDDERFDVLVRDHLVEHPDHVVAAWVAAVHAARRNPTDPTNPLDPTDQINPTGAMP